jgi:hypothetical protein
MPAPNIENVIYGIGRFMFGNPANHATPAALPNDSAAYGASHTGWDEGGFSTRDGFTLGGLSAENAAIEVAQQRAAAGFIPQVAAESLSFTALEATAANLKRLANRGAVATTAPGTSTYGHDDLTLSDDTAVSYTAVLVEVFAPNGNPIRIFFPLAIVRITGDLTFAPTTPTNIPVQVQRVGGASGNPVIRFVKPPTGA